MLTAMRDPSICVLCYTYNHVSYIERCLVGILEQAGDYRIKVIVRDDCSSDGTQDVVRDFANRYPKTVVPILESTNQWPSRKPLLAVMPHIDGDYLAFCEGDDFWNDPGKLQAQITGLERDKGASASFHQVTELNDRTGRKRPTWVLGSGATLDSESLLHPRTVIPTSALVMRNYPDLPFEYANLAPNFDGFLTAFLGTKGYARYEEAVAPSTHRRHDLGVRSAGSLVSRDLDSLLTHYWIAEYLVSCGRRREAAEHLGLVSRIASMGELGRLTGYSARRSWLQSLSRHRMSQVKNQIARTSRAWTRQA